MAARDYPLAAAIQTVRGGLSARAGLAAFRQGGGQIRTQTWYNAVAEVRRTLADSLDEAQRPLGRRPTSGEITQLTTKRRSGFIQQVSVFVRDRETGLVEARPFSWRTDTLITRKAAIGEAMAAFDAGVTQSPDAFDEVVLGATYDGTLQLVPEES